MPRIHHIINVPKLATHQLGNATANFRLLKSESDFWWAGAACLPKEARRFVFRQLTTEEKREEGWTEAKRGHKDPEEQIKRPGKRKKKKKNQVRRQNNRRPLTKPAAASLVVAAQLRFFTYLFCVVCVPGWTRLRGSAAPSGRVFIQKIGIIGREN